MSERKWRHAKNAYGCNFVYSGEGHELVCGGNSHDTLTEDNAALIVRAVNSFDDLVANLKEMIVIADQFAVDTGAYPNIGSIPRGGARGRAFAALAKTNGDE